jgi:hypothetical protein
MTKYKVEAEHHVGSTWAVRVWGNGIGICLVSFSWFQGGKTKAVETALKLQHILDEIEARKVRG